MIKIQLLPGRKYLSGNTLYRPGDFLPDTTETRELVKERRAVLIEEETEENGEGSPLNNPYSPMTVKELTELAKERGITIPSGTKKAGFVALLMAWDAANGSGNAGDS